MIIPYKESFFIKVLWEEQGYTNAIGQDLNVVGAYVEFDVNAFKPKISTELFGGNIRIKFRKLGADGVNLYHRKKGTTV